MLRMVASLIGAGLLVLGQQTIDLSSRLEDLLHQPTPASQPAMNYEIIIIRPLPTPKPLPTPTAISAPIPTPASIPTISTPTTAPSAAPPDTTPLKFEG